jgi:hypothetical protein
MRQAIYTNAVLAALLGLAVCVSPALAQTSGSAGQQKAPETVAKPVPGTTKAANPSGLSYAQKKSICYREGGLRRDLSGDELSRFMQTCMSEVTASQAPSNPRAAWEERCRTEGASQRKLRGDQLASFVKQCMMEE